MNGMLLAVAVLTLAAASPCSCMNNTTASNASVADNRTTLYIGALFNLDVNPDWGVLPMAQQAVQEVNSNAHILPGYKLELVLNSTQGHLGFGQHVFQEYLNTGPRKIMLLGPADDVMAKSIASYAALPHVRLMQFSYGTTDLDLANRRDLYPYFFRTAPSLVSYDAPRIAMLKYYGWKEVGIIYGDSLLYMQLANQFKSRLESNGIEVLAEVRLQKNDPTRAVRTMKDRNVHVIFGMFNYGVSARRLFCSAYRNAMYGPHYVWILLESSNLLGWWIPKSKDRLECEAVEMKCQIQNHFSFGEGGNSRKSQIISHAQKNISTILSDYYALVDSNSSNANRSSHALFVHDAVWSIAMVLDTSRSELKRWNKNLGNISYGDLDALTIFYNETLKLDFSSPKLKNVKYFDNGNRNFDIKVTQLYLRDGGIRVTSAGDLQNGLFTPSKSIRWFAGVPYRKTTESYTYRTIDDALFAVLVMFASFGLLYAVICGVSVALYMKRKRKLLHSAGIVSVLIILGCVLNYVTVILYGFDYTRVTSQTVTNLCRARAWTFSLGFSLSVGGLVAKLWVSYTVLSKRVLMSKKRRLLWMLFLIFFLVIFDIVFLTCWEVTDPLYRKLKIVKTQPQYKCFEPITADTFKVDNTVVETCSCSGLALWLSILLVFKSLVLFFGAFLAWQTRKVYIPSLNSTRRCGVCMFVALVFCVAGIIAAFSAELYPSTFYGFVGFFIIIVTTFILGYLFNYLVVQLFCMRKPSHVACQCCIPCCDRLSVACTKSCQCCPCCERCCVTCWSWLGSCALACCGGPKNPTGGQPDSKLDYVIIGQPFDKDAQITYLQNTIKERDEELKKLRQKRNAVTSKMTQTWESSGEEEDSDDNDGDGNEGGDEGSKNGVSKKTGGNGGGNSRTRKKFKKAARNVKIYNQKLDFSHIQSKVDSNLQPHQKSPRGSISRSSGGDMSRLYGRKGSLAVKQELDEEIKNLKNVLVKKEEEIQRLKSEIAVAGAPKEGRKSTVNAKPQATQSVRISMQNGGAGPTVTQAKPLRSSQTNGPPFSKEPSHPTLVVIDETATAKPNQSDADITCLLPSKGRKTTLEERGPDSGNDGNELWAPNTDEALHESAATAPEHDSTSDSLTKTDASKGTGDETSPLSPVTGENRLGHMATASEGPKETCAVRPSQDNKGKGGEDKDDVITPAGFWLFGKPEERDVSPRVSANEEMSTQNTEAEDDFVEKANLQSGAVTKDEGLSNERDDAGEKKEKTSKGVEEEQTGMDGQENETNSTSAGEFRNKDDAHKDDFLDKTGTLAASEQSRESLQGNEVKADGEVKSRGRTSTDRNPQSSLPVAQNEVATNEVSSQEKEKKEDTANTKNSKPENSDDEFGVVEHCPDGKNSEPTKNDDSMQGNGNFDSQSEGASSGKNTYTSGMFEVDENKDGEVKETVGFGDNSTDSSNNLKGEKKPANNKRVKTRAVKRWTKLRWAANAKVDTGGLRSNPYRTSIKSYKRKNYSHVRSRLFESNSNGGKKTKDGSMDSTEDASRTERRRVLKRPTRSRRKVVGRTLDGSVVKS